MAKSDFRLSVEMCEAATESGRCPFCDALISDHWVWNDGDPELPPFTRVRECECGNFLWLGDC